MLESDENAVAEMLHFYDAMIAAPAMRRASLILGKNWLRLMAGLYPEVKFANLRRAHAHYTVVFGLALKAAGFAQAEAQQLYMFQVLRDQMSAAVRLGIVGPMEATRRQLGCMCIARNCWRKLRDGRTHKRRVARRSSTLPRAYTTIFIRAFSKVDAGMYGARPRPHTRAF